ncbi:MAG: MerR family transcriptional regulator, partial [Actinomycetota bacterium]|nr:MerR family transcriptional regulator [Actinomycetota bacterium]
MAFDTPLDTPSASSSATRKALTIGAVAKILGREFDDISISKIRYLEDQKLLSPRRTPAGYRLYSQADVERLRAILRMQRDEFLPLRVIRQELAGGSDRKGAGAGTATLRRAASVDPAKGSRLDLEELVNQTGASPELLSELEEWRIVQPE